MDPQEQLRQIANDLSLGASGQEQDWGIELSDPRRVSDFLDYYQSRSEPWLPWVRRAYVDLVLESANEALESGEAVPEEGVRRFASDLAARDPEALSYWTSLPSTKDDPWPVQRLLRDASI